MTSTVRTAKRINASQLFAELASGPISVADDGTTRTIEADVSQATLQAAVDAHVAIDEDGNRATLADRAAKALDVNRTYLARTNPTTAQAVAQVETLTRECSALIRLLLGKLDGTD